MTLAFPRVLELQEKQDPVGGGHEQGWGGVLRVESCPRCREGSRLRLERAAGEGERRGRPWRKPEEGASTSEPRRGGSKATEGGWGTGKAGPRYSHFLVVIDPVSENIDL